MLYELVAVVRPGKVAEVKEIAKATGNLILSNRGVIRDIKNWGTFLLTRPRRLAQTRYIDGQHFVMRFDCSPDTQKSVQKMLSLDPRMLQHGIVKLPNQTLQGHANVGPITWTRTPKNPTGMGMGSF